VVVVVVRSPPFVSLWCWHRIVGYASFPGGSWPPADGGGGGTCRVRVLLGGSRGKGGGGCFVWVDWCVVSGSRACGKEGFGVCISGFEGLPEGRAEISRWGARPRIIDLEEGAMLGSE
jgi:hypothetical protein